MIKEGTMTAIVDTMKTRGAMTEEIMMSAAIKAKAYPDPLSGSW